MPRPPHPGPGRTGAPPEKVKDMRGTLTRLLHEIKKFKIYIIAVFIFAIGSCIFNTVGPRVLSLATTELFNGAAAGAAGTGSINFQFIAQVLAATLCLYLLSAGCSFTQGWLMTRVSQDVCYQLRGEIVEKINRLPFASFDRMQKGDVLSRITNDVDTLGQSLNQGITQLITSAVTILGVLVMMLTINPLMTLVVLCVIPLSAFLVKLIVRVSQKYFVAQQALLGSVNAQVEETVSGHTEMQAFNQQEATLKKFNDTNDKLFNAAWKSQFMSGLMKPCMDVVGNAAYVVVAIMGCVFAARGTITVGDIQAFIQYVKNFTQPISQLAQVSNVLQQLAAAAERIFEFLDEPEDSEDAEDAQDSEDAEDAANAHSTEREESHTAASASITLGDVDFNNVCFAYNNEGSAALKESSDASTNANASSAPQIIKNFTAHIKCGQTVALVGPTGAGKTTIVKLLMRFYDPTSGTICINGKDITQINKHTLRQNVGMVLQDTWLFHGTIRENIRYGNLSATDAQVEAAARAGCAHDFIQRLPGSYDFEINEEANNVSAGQKQLLTIARAILANRGMLILDEATSNVDTHTEARIQAAMNNLMQGKTCFVIAHRLSTIKGADVVLVMREGEIVERGTHEQLLAQNGFYAQLYNSQFEDCKD